MGLRLVDWADEEGARFGRSLFGSSACAGTLDVGRGARPARPRRRAPGGRGRPLRRGARPRARVGRPAARRARLPRAAHRAGPGAGEPRRAGRGGARHVRRRAPPGRLHRPDRARRRHADGAAPRHASRRPPRRRSRSARSASATTGVCTVGGATSEPGVVTAVAGRTEMLLDQRHLDPDALAAMLAEAREACEQAAADHGCEVELRHLWSIPPIPFDDRLIALARAGGGRRRRQGHRHPERAAARRRRDGAPAADRDDLLSSSPPRLAHEGGGHARGRPARGDRGLRPHRGCHARAGAPRASCPRASERAQRAARLPRGVEPVLRASACAARACESAADLARLPFTTKEELREGQRREPPFGPHLCAPRERLVRMHVTSGTTGEPVAVGFTRARPRGQQRGRRRGVPDRRAAARRHRRPLPQLRALRGRHRRPHGARGERRDGRAGRAPASRAGCST